MLVIIHLLRLMRCSQIKYLSPVVTSFQNGYRLKHIIFLVPLGVNPHKSSYCICRNIVAYNWNLIKFIAGDLLFLVIANSNPVTNALGMSPMGAQLLQISLEPKVLAIEKTFFVGLTFA